MCVFVLDEETPGIRPLGGAARWWLHGSLTALGDALEAIGGRLVLRRGPADRVIRSLVDETGAGAVFWNRRYGGPERELDAGLKQALHDDGLIAHSFAANLLFEPWTIRTGQGTPFSVFTPFWRACRSAPEPRHPLPAPDAIDPADAAERRPRRLGAVAHPTPTGRTACARRGRPGRMPRTSACGTSSTTTCPRTRRDATNRRRR